MIKLTHQANQLTLMVETDEGTAVAAEMYAMLLGLPKGPAECLAQPVPPKTAGKRSFKSGEPFTVNDFRHLCQTCLISPCSCKKPQNHGTFGGKVPHVAICSGCGEIVCNCPKEGMGGVNTPPVVD